MGRPRGSTKEAMRERCDQMLEIPDEPVYYQSKKKLSDLQKETREFLEKIYKVDDNFNALINKLNELPYTLLEGVLKNEKAKAKRKGFGSGLSPEKFAEAKALDKRLSARRKSGEALSYAIGIFEEADAHNILNEPVVPSTDLPSQEEQLARRIPTAYKAGKPDVALRLQKELNDLKRDAATHPTPMPMKLPDEPGTVSEPLGKDKDADYYYALVQAHRKKRRGKPKKRH